MTSADVVARASTRGSNASTRASSASPTSSTTSSRGDAFERVLARLRSASKEVVQISRAQMGQFCGNVLELLDGRGRPILALSEAAHLGFTGEDRLTLSRHVADFVSVPIPTIESVGGGSVRCCIAELFP